MSRDDRPRSSFARALRLALILLGLAVGGIALASTFLGDSSDLPFDYERFE